MSTQDAVCKKKATKNEGMKTRKQTWFARWSKCHTRAGTNRIEVANDATELWSKCAHDINLWRSIESFAQ